MDANNAYRKEIAMQIEEVVMTEEETTEEETTEEETTEEETTEEEATEEEATEEETTDPIEKIAPTNPIDMSNSCTR